MTEKTLNKAMEIKRKADRFREEKDNLEKHAALCLGNASEVNARGFL